VKGYTWIEIPIVYKSVHDKKGREAMNKRDGVVEKQPVQNRTGTTKQIKINKSTKYPTNKKSFKIIQQTLPTTRDPQTKTASIAYPHHRLASPSPPRLRLDDL
jgi:hypothetical protein